MPVSFDAPNLWCESNGWTCVEYDPDAYYEVTFAGAGYICAHGVVGGVDECERYFGGSGPLNIFPPDLWCDQYDGCSEYDPDEYFELTSGGNSFICQQAVSFQRYDCERYYGGSVSHISPVLYCSGREASPDCSEFWYPDELRHYEISTIGGQTYLCEDAFAFEASFGDKDCYVYYGGQPYVGGFPDQKCSSDGRCDRQYYPSQLDGIVFVTIDFQDYACEEVWDGLDCYRQYISDIPSMWGRPDMYCNRSGECDSRGRP